MTTICRDELLTTLQQDRPVTLVMALGPDRYAQAHIPGSVTFPSVNEAMESLDRDDDIVVYCSHEACSASRQAAHLLTQAGFTRVRRYPGGLTDWHAAGLPLAGEMATTQAVAA